jgi:phosphate/sulfate permease
MAHTEHSNLREGLIAGLIGALVVEAWYLAIDVGRGELFYTSNLLGQVFVTRDARSAAVSPEAVVQYSLLHFAWFFLFGVGLAALTHVATRTPAFRMALWLFLVIGSMFFFGLSYMLTWWTGLPFPWWASLIGALLGSGVMAFYLLRGHPGLRATSAPLGAEVRPPPHPR